MTDQFPEASINGSVKKKADCHIHLLRKFMDLSPTIHYKFVSMQDLNKKILWKYLPGQLISEQG